MAQSDATPQMKFDTPYMWLVLLAIILANFGGAGLLFGVTSIFAREYPFLLNRTQTETNIIGSTAIGTMLISAPPIEAFSKQFGSRMTAGVGSIFVIGGFLVSAFCSQIWHFVLGYSIITGLGSSSLLIASVDIVHQYCQRFKNVGFACIGLGCTGSVFASPMILNAIKSSGATFRNTCLYLLGISALTLTAPIFFRQRIHEDVKRKVTLAAFLKPLKRCYTLVFLLQAFLWNAGFIGFLILLFTQVDTHYGNEIATLANTLYGGGEFASAVILPLIMIKFQPNINVLQVVFNCCGGVAIIAFAAFRHKYVYCVLSGIIGFCNGSIITLLPLHAYFLYRRDESNMAYAYQQALGGISGILGPMSGTYIKKLYGSSAAYYYLGSLTLLAAISIMINGIIRPSTCRPANLPDQPDSNRSVDQLEQSAFKLDELDIDAGRAQSNE